MGSQEKVGINDKMATHGKKDRGNYEEDLDDIDFNNYKGMFYEDDPGSKYQDPLTGAHFEYRDMCRQLSRLQTQLEAKDQVLELSDDVDSEESDSPIECQPHLEQQTAHALKAAYALRLRSQQKESRNTVQALPQQGYGTTGLQKVANPVGKQRDDHTIRKHSTQFELPAPTHKRPKDPERPIVPLPPPPGPGPNAGTIAMQGSGRSKSLEKHHFAVIHQPNTGHLGPRIELTRTGLGITKGRQVENMGKRPTFIES